MRPIVAYLAITLIFATSVSMGSAPGIPLTVSVYTQITVERLELAISTWGSENRPPTAIEEAALFTAHGTTARLYYGFMSRNSRQVRAYLDSHPVVADRISELAQQLRAFISQTDTGPDDWRSDPDSPGETRGSE